MRSEQGPGHRVARLRTWLIRIGLVLLVPSLGLFSLGLAGLIDAERFALGQGSGLRVIAGFAVLGCLLAAVGYWDEK